MSNRSGFAMVIVLIIGAVLMASAGFYLYRTTAVQKYIDQNRSAVVSTSTPSNERNSQDEIAIIEGLQKVWTGLYEQLGVTTTPWAWNIDAVQFIGNNHLIVEFEDGHQVNLAVLKHQEQADFSVEKVLKGIGVVPLSDWQKIITQYGDSNYPISNYTKGVTRDNKYVSFPILTKVPENVLGFSKVKIALLAMPAKDEDMRKLQGCDVVDLKEVQVYGTTMPLTWAMKELFVRREPWPYTETRSGNYISKQTNLSFDKATLENGVAKIYLTGSISLGGECDDPRLNIVIENTAKQFASVKSVEIYLNGQPYVAPNERG